MPVLQKNEKGQIGKCHMKILLFIKGIQQNNVLNMLLYREEKSLLNAYVTELAYLKSQVKVNQADHRNIEIISTVMHQINYSRSETELFPLIDLQPSMQQTKVEWLRARGTYSPERCRSECSAHHSDRHQQ